MSMSTDLGQRMLFPIAIVRWPVIEAAHADNPRGQQAGLPIHVINRGNDCAPISQSHWTLRLFF